jgi:von willebrand factor, type A
MAGKISSMGIPCFACNPEKLPLLLERVLKGLDLNSFQEEFKKK